MIVKSAQTAKVGKIFKNARLQKSLSLSEVSTEAVINVEYIRAIESGDYSIFPSRTYTVKYFEKYANFLSITPRFFDIYNVDVVAKAEKEKQALALKQTFFDKSKIFIFLLVISTLLAIIFLMIPNTPNEKESIQISENLKVFSTTQFNTDSDEDLEFEKTELNNQINSTLYDDKLDSNKVNGNVDSIEPDA
tara:strand:- start:1329 stop:1904 length:576 start_codon:yes stop_codon:yes gene_type:complete